MNRQRPISKASFAFMLRAKVNVIAILFLFAPTLFMVAPCAQCERLPVRVYTTADGLVQNVVNRIVRDSRGFLWFCTDGGLSRYDGYSFTNYGVEQGLPDSQVRDLLETREGQYFVSA